MSGEVKHSKWHKFAELAKFLSPIVLSFTAPKLVPVASVVADAIGEAEALPGASGSDKLAHATKIATDTADALNKAKGKVVISPDDLSNTLAKSVSTVVDVINLIHPKSEQK